MRRTLIALILATTAGAFYDVGVMNVWETDSSGRRIARQDHLINLSPRRVPDGGTTLVLLGMAVSGLAAVNRRFRKG